MQLGEMVELEAQMLNLKQMSIRILNIQLSTEPPFLLNPCCAYVQQDYHFLKHLRGGPTFFVLYASLNLAISSSVMFLVTPSLILLNISFILPAG